jgi:hypothetical protein
MSVRAEGVDRAGEAERPRAEHAAARAVGWGRRRRRTSRSAPSPPPPASRPRRSRACCWPARGLAAGQRHAQGREGGAGPRRRDAPREAKSHQRVSHQSLLHHGKARRDGLYLWHAARGKRPSDFMRAQAWREAGAVARPRDRRELHASRVMAAHARYLRPGCSRGRGQRASGGAATRGSRSTRTIVPENALWPCLPAGFLCPSGLTAACAQPMHIFTRTYDTWRSAAGS